ncbi:MAG: hypothetical protein ACRYGF_06225 [Janthinobacterium lividum]
MQRGWPISRNSISLTAAVDRPTSGQHRSTDGGAVRGVAVGLTIETLFAFAVWLTIHFWSHA